MDSNHDGMLSKSEISGMLLEFGGEDLDKVHLKNELEQFWTACTMTEGWILRSHAQELGAPRSGV